jgi:oligosaccharide 4-alpha-D-glucosyltransferase
MSMSGIPYVHSDAGGFAGGEGDFELYVRWLQMAAFTPIFRPHGTALYDKDPNAFSFPSEAALIKNPFKQYAKKIIDLRYQLMPYNYTLAYEQTKLGKPLISPMYYQYQNDTAVYNIGDEYCWGEKIIVAPIIQKNTNARNVWIPKSGAYKFGTNIYLKEGMNQDSASIENQLLYIPQGSLIPTQKVIEGANSTAYKNPVIQWQYYVPRNHEFANKTSFTLYEDDGSNKNSIAQKNYEEITLTALPHKDGYVFKISSNGGTFKGKQTNRKMDIKIFGCTKNITTFHLNNSKKASSTTTSESDSSVNISFEFDGRPLTIYAQ